MRKIENALIIYKAKLELRGGNLAFSATAMNSKQNVEFAQKVANVYRARQTTNDLSFAKTLPRCKNLFTAAF